MTSSTHRKYLHGSKGERMKRLVMLTTLLAALAVPSAALSLEDLKITDQGTTCRAVNNGTAVNCIGKYTGIGASYSTVSIEIKADYTCTNKAGNTVVGQSASSSGPIEVRNGQVTFNETTSSVSDKCTKADDHTATFTTATISIVDANGNVIRSFTYVVQ